MKFASLYLSLALALAFGSSFGAEVLNGSEPQQAISPGARKSDQLRQLEKIRQARTEAQRQLDEAEQRLSAIRATQGVQGDQSQQSWPRKIIDTVRGNWIRPPIEETGTAGCAAAIELADNGDVMSVAFDPPCNPKILQRSIEAAIIKSSPFPLPNDPASFHRHLVINFFPRDGA